MATTSCWGEWKSKQAVSRIVCRPCRAAAPELSARRHPFRSTARALVARPETARRFTAGDCPRRWCRVPGRGLRGLQFAAMGDCTGAADRLASSVLCARPATFGGSRDGCGPGHPAPCPAAGGGGGRRAARRRGPGRRRDDSAQRGTGPQEGADAACGCSDLRAGQALDTAPTVPKFRPALCS